jgi:hypothetical protein
MLWPSKKWIPPPQHPRGECFFFWVRSTTTFAGK